MADVVLANTAANLSGATVVKTSGSPTTNALAKFTAAGTITSGDLSGDVTTSSSLVTTIANSAVTLAKIQNASANSKLLGSGAAGSGSPYAEITLGTNLSMSGTTLNATGGGATTTSPIILGTYTASAAATLPVTTRNAAGTSGNIFQADYTQYELRLTNFIPATNGQPLRLQVSTDGGSTWVTASSSYFGASQYITSASTTGVYNDTAGGIGSTGVCVLDTTSTASSFDGGYGYVILSNPLATIKHDFKFETGSFNGTNIVMTRGFWWTAGTTAYTAFRLLFGSGNITSGTLTVLGYA